MNIFYLDPDPKACAEMHCDKHVVKMIIEYAQLMSTAHRMIDGDEYTDLSINGRKIKRWRHPELNDVLMKASHVYHPSNVWLRQCNENYQWLYHMWLFLLNEYTYRYGKIHACARLKDVLGNIPKNITIGSFTPPTPAMPDDCKVLGNSLKSYHIYYATKKEHLWSWSGKINSRQRPAWLSDMLKQAKDSCHANV